MTQDNIIRRLREAWFNRVLKFIPPERQWEDEAEALRREENNRRMRRQYDLETEAIIEGSQTCNLTPQCWNDLGGDV